MHTSTERSVVQIEELSKKSAKFLHEITQLLETNAQKPLDNQEQLLRNYLFSIFKSISVDEQKYVYHQLSRGTHPDKRTLLSNHNLNIQDILNKVWNDVKHQQTHKYTGINPLSYVQSVDQTEAVVNNKYYAELQEIIVSVDKLQRHNPENIDPSTFMATEVARINKNLSYIH